MKKLLIFQLLTFILVPIVNFVPNLFLESPFGDDPKTLIQPAGYAFSIWGPIFLGMLIFSVFQLKTERVDSPHLRTATIAAISAGWASIAFVPISYSDIQGLALVDILWHLASLIVLFIALRKQILLEKAPNTKWFYLPTQMYLGWISAATAVSVALFLRQSFGVDLPYSKEVMVTFAVIAALTAVAIFINSINGSIVSLTIVWALVGIIVANQDSAISWAAGGAITLILLAVVVHLLQGKSLSYA